MENQQLIEQNTQIVRAKLETAQLSLYELLDIMNRVDEDLIGLNESEMDFVGELTAEKIDNIKSFRDYVLSRADVLKKQAEELTTAKRQLENLADRLTKNVAKNMELQGFKKLPGYRYQAGLREKEKIEIKNFFI